MLQTTLKPKPCVQCGSMFMPFSSTSRVCGRMCASRLVRAENDAKKAEFKARKEKLKTNGQRKAEAQAALNRWIVHVRDTNLPCISCGRHHQGMYHAGHYRSRGSSPHLALDPRNLHKQCAPCNMHLHGNLIAYRQGLVQRYGLEYVEALESDQGPVHMTGADYDELKVHYRNLTRKAPKETS